jgi:ubiquinone/menaquinone biosynthesis C-methylase UbiE
VGGRRDLEWSRQSLSRLRALQEMARVLKPGGRLQIGDILIQKSLDDKAKRDIDLWKG